MFFFWDGTFQLFVGLKVSCIEAAVTDSLKMLFRDVPDKPPDEIHCRYGFLHINIILMAVVVESDILAVIAVNARSGNNGPAKITSNIFEGHFRLTSVWFGIDIEAVLIVFVTERFGLFKGWPNLSLHFIQECGAEGIAQVIVIKMGYSFPKAGVTQATFG